MQGVDEIGVEESADGLRASTEADVPAVGGCTGLIQDVGGGAVDEVERGVGEGEGRARVVGEHEDGGVEGRLVAPPAPPLVVCPGPAMRAELVAAIDLRADVVVEVAGQVVVEPA